MTIVNDILDKDKKGNTELIIIAGGTGLQMKYVTIEAIKPLLEKEAAGLMHYLNTER